MWTIVSIISHSLLIYTSTYFYQIQLIIRNTQSCITKCRCYTPHKLSINSVYKKISYKKLMSVTMFAVANIGDARYLSPGISDGNAVETAVRVFFDLSYTYNTHENRFTKPLKAIFCENNYFVCQSYGKRHKKPRQSP